MRRRIRIPTLRQSPLGFARPRNHLRPCWVLVIALLCLAVGAVAGPILPAKRRPSDRIRSLAQLQQMRVQVESLKSEETFETEITKEWIESRIKYHFERVGIQIADDEADAPVFIFRNHIVGDESVPDGVAFTFLLLVQQDVHLPRLKIDIQVPTFATAAVSLEPKDEFDKIAQLRIDSILNRFVRQVTWATESMEK